jgi:tetratricopeptide (TPR) repeat protein
VGYAKLGTIASAQKHPKDALAYFETALKKDPASVDALASILSIYAGQGETKKGIERGLAQAKVTPKDPRIYNLIARLYLVAKDPAQAEEYYNKSIEVDPNFLQTYMDLGRLYLAKGDQEKAVEKLESMLKIKKDFVPAHMVIGMIFEGQKDYNKAKARYEEVLKINPKFGPAANNLAWLLLQQGGDIDKALALAQTAHEQLPQDPNVADTLGWAQYKKGALLKAISTLKDATDKAPTAGMMQYHLGMAYYKNGDKVQAKQALQASLKLSQDFPGIDEAKKVLQEL